MRTYKFDQWDGKNNIYPAKFSSDTSKVLFKSEDGDRTGLWNPQREGIAEFSVGSVSTELTSDGTVTLSQLKKNKSLLLHALLSS